MVKKLGKDGVFDPWGEAVGSLVAISNCTIDGNNWWGRLKTKNLSGMAWVRSNVDANVPIRTVRKIKRSRLEILELVKGKGTSLRKQNTRKNPNSKSGKRPEGITPATL